MYLALRLGGSDPDHFSIAPMMARPPGFHTETDLPLKYLSNRSRTATAANPLRFRQQWKSQVLLLH
jgi:hypothetical protein